MALTIGQQLRAAREEQGLSVEDLAHETRIHSNFIRSLEADDYSGFASITYAKSFLQLYSRHLNIDASEALSVFKGNNSVNLHGSSLLSDTHESVEPPGSPMNSRSMKRKRSSEKPGGAPIFLGIILGVLLIAIPTFYFLGYNAENPEDVAKVIAKNANDLKDNIGTSGKSNGTSEIQANPLAVKSTKPPVVEEAPEAEPQPESVADAKPIEEPDQPTGEIAANDPPKSVPADTDDAIDDANQNSDKPTVEATETPIVAKPVDNGTPRLSAVESAGGSQAADSPSDEPVEPTPVPVEENPEPEMAVTEHPVKPIEKVVPIPPQTTTGLPPVKKIPRDKPPVVASTESAMKPKKPTADPPPLRATPIIARPIVNPKPQPETEPDLTELLPDDDLRGTNEEPDARPMEDITPKPKKLKFNPGQNRFPRRPE